MPEKILGRIQSESREAVRHRESRAFDQLAGPLATRLVLFGAGPLGRSALAGLRKAGVEPLAFADNNRSLWGMYVDGLVVVPPNEAANRYGHSACFVVTIYNGLRVRSQLASLGCNTIAPFTPLFWKYAKIFIPDSCVELPHTLTEQLDAVRACYTILYDGTSRQELLGQLAWRYWLDYDALPPSLDPRHTYFPLDLLRPNDDEVFVDCGSFDGQTIRSFMEHWSQWRHIFALEPDPANLLALYAAVQNMGISANVTVVPYAASDRNGTTGFISTGTVTSHVGSGGHCAVECKRLDEIDWRQIPTYVKMDIEGAEPKALQGGRELLKKHRPVLAVCTYHRGAHLWEIPNLIHSIAPDYRIFLRRYAEECWEGVCYAIPADRLRSS